MSRRRLFASSAAAGRRRRRSARGARAVARRALPLPQPRPAARAARRRPAGPPDARGEGLAADRARGAGRAPRHPAVPVVGRGAARRGAHGPRHRVPAGDRPGGHLGRRADAARRDGDLRRGAGHEQRLAGARQARPLPGPRLLVAEHQHLPRPALGPRPGDLRRGPVPHRRHRHRVRARHAGQRPAVPEDGRHRQALRGPQRTRVAAPRLRRAGERDRPARDLPAGLPRAGGRRQGRVGDVRLQRRSAASPPAAATSCSARCCAASGASRATSSPTAAR